MEFNSFVIHNPDAMTRNISLRDLSEIFQKFRLDDKIALFSEYANNDDLATIDERDVLADLIGNNLTQTNWVTGALGVRHDANSSQLRPRGKLLFGVKTKAAASFIRPSSRM